MSELNHNEPTKELVAVQLTCPYCEKKEPPLLNMIVQMETQVGKMLFALVLCAYCGKPIPGNFIGQVPGPIVQPKVVLPGRIG